MNISSHPLVSYLKHLSPRNIWQKHLLYNKMGLALLSAINKVRWPYIDITLIVWPPARPFFSEIESAIRDRYKIVESALYRIEEPYFEEFVRRVYDIDSASHYKISYKLEHLVRPPLDIRVIKVRFPRPNMEVQDLLNRVRCLDVHALKAEIRASYRDRVEGYVFDIIIHSTETAKQGIEVQGLLNKYGTMVESMKSD